jgi:hypothetical protein
MSDTVLVLRTCNADLTSYNGFQWPESGSVECPDWSPEPICGNGLHGLLWGEGSPGYLNLQDSAKWLVVEVASADIVDVDGKVKFPRGTVVYCGDRTGATEYLYSHGAAGKPVVYGTATAGDYGTATAGDYGTATAGDGGTATAGDGGTATAGDGGTATAGYRGCICIAHWNGKRYKMRVAEVGEGGLKPNVKYRLNDAGEFVEVNE